MPIIIDGHMVVAQSKVEAHEGHNLKACRGERFLSLICMDCQNTLSDLELERPAGLPCGCFTQSEHDEGVALQTQLRKDFRIPRSTCVGCYLGDDGPSVHSCYVHQF